MDDRVLLGRYETIETILRGNKINSQSNNTDKYHYILEEIVYT